MASRSGVETDRTCNDTGSEGHRVACHIRVGPLSGGPRATFGWRYVRVACAYHVAVVVVVLYEVRCGATFVWSCRRVGRCVCRCTTFGWVVVPHSRGSWDPSVRGHVRVVWVDQGRECRSLWRPHTGMLGHAI